MAPLTITDDLSRVARRCVWFKTPEEALAYPEHFIEHVLTYGTHEDVRTLRRRVSDAQLKEALDNALRHLRWPVVGLLAPDARLPRGASAARAEFRLKRPPAFPAPVVARAP